MKRNIFTYILTLLLAMAGSQGHAQGIVVYEHNGIQTNITAAEFDCIVPDEGAGLKGVVVKRLDGSSLKVAADQLDSVNTYAQAYDERLTYSIPEIYVDKMGKHMPIFSGNTPPAIEGVYDFSPNVAVYFEDHADVTGREYTSLVMRFDNHDKQKNTLDYTSHDVGSSTSSSARGAAIIGEGANFTCFFISEGESNGIYIKLATLISGTMTPSGIRNMYHGFVLLDKGDDPNNTLMKKGVYRVFKDGDGISTTTTWANVATFDAGEEPLDLPQVYDK